MVKMGLKQPDRTEKWSHPPKKKWIYNYLADGKAVLDLPPLTDGRWTRRPDQEQRNTADATH